MRREVHGRPRPDGACVLRRSRGHRFRAAHRVRTAARAVRRAGVGHRPARGWHRDAARQVQVRQDDADGAALWRRALRRRRRLVDQRLLRRHRRAAKLRRVGRVERVGRPLRPRRLRRHRRVRARAGEADGRRRRGRHAGGAGCAARNGRASRDARLRGVRLLQAARRHRVRHRRRQALAGRVPRVSGHVLVAAQGQAGSAGRRRAARPQRVAR
mmetsp:Transcript_38674/g.124898  ORF Transcript_38674/g.124898 Transcript_38674/m.124898 type:complete len:214 (+) Transcript_38674:115-756(+)